MFAIAIALHIPFAFHIAFAFNNAFIVFACYNAIFAF
jgi:hypothetical protein